MEQTKLPWLIRANGDQEQKAKDTEARREKARQRKKTNLDVLRQQYQQDTGFLPPTPKK